MRLPALPSAAASGPATALAAVVMALVALAFLPDSRARAAPATVPWSETAIEAIEQVPVQDGGRVKPLLTWARFRLISVNGRSSFEDPEEEKRTSTEWLLDALFRPERAQTYRVFLVQDDAVLDAIGLARERNKKRDRYSYLELLPGRDRLLAKGEEWRTKAVKDRTLTEDQLVNLASEVVNAEVLFHTMEFARHRFDTAGVPAVEKVMGASDDVRFSQVMAKASELIEVIRAAQDAHGADPATWPKDAQALYAFWREAFDAVQGSRALAFLPPVGGVDREPEWLTPFDVADRIRFGITPDPAHVALLARLETLAASGNDLAAFDRELTAFRDDVRKLADARGEYDKIGLEVTYYRLDPLSKSLVAFLLAFALAAVSWMAPRSKPLAIAVTSMVGIALALLVTAIVMRCVIRGRPPISTLYETVLFITAAGVSTCLFIEWLNRQRVALSLAAVLGAVGLFIANKYEVLNKEDTMPSLVAVLDTNFWLSTHVTCVTFGYAAGLVAGVLAHVHILGKALGLKAGDDAFYRAVARMVYGVVCFGLFFSVVGTILGGIWANESWGRFWGWDPKENGALMIVLWELAILHARMGGFVKGHGLAMMAVFGNIVIAFSWWGVNLLSVGLHSYGFTSGISTAVNTFYAFEVAVLATGAVWWLLQNRAAAAPPKPL